MWPALNNNQNCLFTCTLIIYQTFKNYWNTFHLVRTSGVRLGPATEVGRSNAPQSSMEYLWRFACGNQHPIPWQSSCGLCRHVLTGRLLQIPGWQTATAEQQTLCCQKSSSYILHRERQCKAIRKQHKKTFFSTVCLWKSIYFCWYTGLILNRSNGGNCLHCPWSLPWCHFKSPNRNLQIPHRGALCQGKIALPLQVSGMDTWNDNWIAHVCMLHSGFLFRNNEENLLLFQLTALNDKPFPCFFTNSNDNQCSCMYT